MAHHQAGEPPATGQGFFLPLLSERKLPCSYTLARLERIDYAMDDWEAELSFPPGALPAYPAEAGGDLLLPDGRRLRLVIRTPPAGGRCRARGSLLPFSPVG